MGNCITNIRLKKYKHCNELPLYIDKYNGKSVSAKVVDVYDGDTITIIIYDKEYKKFKFRMFGYDAPEMKPSTLLHNRDNYIKCANISKNYLTQLILNNIVTIKFNEKCTDKYGRLLGTVYYKGININDKMVNDGKALPYYTTSNDSKKLEYTDEMISNMLMYKSMPLITK